MVKIYDAIGGILFLLAIISALFLNVTNAIFLVIGAGVFMTGSSLLGELRAMKAALADRSKADPPPTS